MELIDTKIIANEHDFSTSNIKYKVQYHGATKHITCNQAEILAQNEDNVRILKEVEKTKQIEDGMIKMKQNLKLHNKKDKENKKLLEEKKIEKEEKKKKISEYNSTLQNRIKNKLNSSKSLIIDNNSSNLHNNISNKGDNSEFKSSNFTNNVENENLENQWTLAENNIEISNTNNNIPNNQTVNLRDNIESLIKAQLINRCLKSKDLKQQQCEDEEESNTGDLDKLRLFRKYGKVEAGKQSVNNVNDNLLSKKNEEKNINDKIADEKQSKQYLQFKKELEKRRIFIF